ncbi:MAG: hypothetical protein ACOCZ5_00400 [bacterium]
MRYRKYDTPVKLFERFERVNKVKLDESVFDTDNLESKLIEYYDQLKQNKLNIQSVNTNVNGGESFVELIGRDQQGNTITFNFKTRFDGGDQDGVFNLVDGELIEFSFVDLNGEDIEINEDGLSEFNERYSNEIIDIISDYVDVESNQPEQTLYNEAVKKIDNRTFKPLSLHENVDINTTFENLPTETKSEFLEIAEKAFRRYLGGLGVNIDAYPEEEFNRAVNKIANELFIEKSKAFNEEYPDPIAKSFSSKKSDPFKEKRSSKKTMVVNELNTDTVAGYSNIDLPQDNIEGSDIDNYEPMNVGDDNTEDMLLGYQPIRENEDGEQRELCIDREVLVGVILGISENVSEFQKNLFRQLGAVSTYASLDDVREQIAQLDDSKLETLLINFAYQYAGDLNESIDSGEHCVIWDGTSAYIAPSTDKEEELAAGNEVLKHFDDIDAAQEYADQVNAEAYKYER